MAGDDDELVRVRVQVSAPPAVRAICDDVVLADAHKLHVEVITPSCGNPCSYTLTVFRKMLLHPLWIIGEDVEAWVFQVLLHIVDGMYVVALWTSVVEVCEG